MGAPPYETKTSLAETSFDFKRSGNGKGSRFDASSTLLVEANTFEAEDLESSDQISQKSGKPLYITSIPCSKIAGLHASMDMESFEFIFSQLFQKAYVGFDRDESNVASSSVLNFFQLKDTLLLVKIELAVYNRA